MITLMDEYILYNIIYDYIITDISDIKYIYNYELICKDIQHIVRKNNIMIELREKIYKILYEVNYKNAICYIIYTSNIIQNNIIYFKNNFSLYKKGISIINPRITDSLSHLNCKNQLFTYNELINHIINNIFNSLYLYKNELNYIYEDKLIISDKIKYIGISDNIFDLQEYLNKNYNIVCSISKNMKFKKFDYLFSE